MESISRGQDMEPAALQPGFTEAIVSRRRLLQIGGLGLFGLNLTGLLRAEAQRSLRPGRQKTREVRSCILVFYYGGPSHLDTWDMKPAAPAEIRGAFRPAATRVPGVRICEHLPHMARVLHHCALVRSLHHPMRNHNAAAVEALCGRSPLKGDLELLADDAASFPCYGAALSYLMPPTPPVPPYVALPHVMYNVVTLPGQTAGFLGSAYNALQVTRDPNAPAFGPGELELPADLSLARLEDRRSLLHLMEGQVQTAERTAANRTKDGFYDRAFGLLSSDAVRRAFDLDGEDVRTRDRYGRTKHGQSLLLARRLVESGVRFVTVYDGVRNGQDENWDSHQAVFTRLKDHLLPPTDRGLAALIEDLHDRGLLDSTLVIALGEFGRTPRINAQAGRDHWPDCYSALLAGGGVHGGTVYGASDRIGAYPDADPVTPGDLAATLFWRFGQDPESEIHDITGRPYRLAEGQPLTSLFAT